MRFPSTSRRIMHPFAAAGAAALLGVCAIALSPRPAEAFGIGIGFGFPGPFFAAPFYGYPPPPAYYYPPPAYYYPAAPVAAPGAAAPVAVPGAAAPVAVPGVAAPVAIPGAAAPIAAISYTSRPAFQNSAGQLCREYEAAKVIDGRSTIAYGTACRDGTGQWRIAQ